MKSLTFSLTMAAYALFATSALARLESCSSSHSHNDFEYSFADYSPSPVSTSDRICIDIQGELKTTLPIDAKITFELKQDDISEDWVVDGIYSALDLAGAPPMPFGPGTSHLKPCFYFPPSFASVKSDSRISIRAVGTRKDSNNSEKRIFCVRGTVSVA